jgi:hypothetical protein
MFRRYIAAISTLGCTLGALRVTGCITWGTTEGFLVISVIHVVYYILIIEMGKPSGRDLKETHVNKQKQKVPRRQVKPQVNKQVVQEGTLEDKVNEQDIILALVTMGIKKGDAYKTLNKVKMNHPSVTRVDDLLKLCLKN